MSSFVIFWTNDLFFSFFDHNCDFIEVNEAFGGVVTGADTLIEDTEVFACNLLAIVDAALFPGKIRATDFLLGFAANCPWLCERNTWPSADFKWSGHTFAVWSPASSRPFCCLATCRRDVNAIVFKF